MLLDTHAPLRPQVYQSGLASTEVAPPLRQPQRAGSTGWCEMSPGVTPAPPLLHQEGLFTSEALTCLVTCNNKDKNNDDDNNDSK